MPTQRHTLTAHPEWLQEARDAVDGFVAGLQAGIDSADAQTYNADFAEDVIWGSPYGATVTGYDALHSIHRGMSCGLPPVLEHDASKLITTAAAATVAAPRGQRRGDESGGTLSTTGSTAGSPSNRTPSFARGAAVAGASSLYQTVHVMAPTPDVAIAHVRRVAIDADGQPVPIDDASVFSEMAMYVLVRRDGKWWLAAGQNTPIRPKP